MEKKELKTPKKNKFKLNKNPTNYLKKLVNE